MNKFIPTFIILCILSFTGLILTLLCPLFIVFEAMIVYATYTCYRDHIK